MAPTRTSRRTRRGRNPDESGGILAVLTDNQPPETDNPSVKKKEASILPKEVVVLQQQTSSDNEESDVEENDAVSEMTSPRQMSEPSPSTDQTSPGSPCSALSEEESFVENFETEDEDGSKRDSDDSEESDEGDEEDDEDEDEALDEIDDEELSNDDDDEVDEDIVPWKEKKNSKLGDADDNEEDSEMEYEVDDEYDPDEDDETEAEEEDAQDDYDELELDPDDLRITQKQSKIGAAISSQQKTGSTATAILEKKVGISVNHNSEGCDATVSGNGCGACHEYNDEEEVDEERWNVKDDIHTTQGEHTDGTQFVGQDERFVVSKKSRETTKMDNIVVAQILTDYASDDGSVVEVEAEVDDEDFDDIEDRLSGNGVTHPITERSDAESLVERSKEQDNSTDDSNYVVPSSTHSTQKAYVVEDSECTLQQHDSSPVTADDDDFHCTDNDIVCESEHEVNSMEQYEEPELDYRMTDTDNECSHFMSTDEMPSVQEPCEEPDTSKSSTIGGDSCFPKATSQGNQEIRLFPVTDMELRADSPQTKNNGDDPENDFDGSHSSDMTISHHNTAPEEVKVCNENPSYYSGETAKTLSQDSARGTEKATMQRQVSVQKSFAQMQLDDSAATRTHVSHEPPIVRTRSDGIVKQGQWTLGSRIGIGSFGVVHVGMNKRTGSLMAVKSIPMQPDIMKDVRREIELLKTLHHTNIVRYYGAEINGSDLHIFQEWVAGGSVTDLLSKFGPFSFSVTQSYAEQILRGLEYLHANNILHRDIKGSNILVSDEGVVKLADFGGSRKIAELNADMMMSMTVRGTPYFMAPEVFEQKYSSKADVWAFGCVLYQMITATSPWKHLGYNSPFVLCRHLQTTEGPPPLPRTLCCARGDLLNHLLSILECCFSRTPFERPTVAELLNDSFFLEKDYLSDDDHSEAPGLFSPEVIRTSRGLEQSPLSKQAHSKIVSSPVRNLPGSRTPNRQRRKSIGTCRSPFMSPPLPNPRDVKPSSPLPYSPAKDTSDWPSWAKKKHSNRNHQAGTTTMLESLAFSTDSSMHPSRSPMESTSKRSPLQGLSFLPST